MKKKKRNNKKRALVYVRYLYPSAALLLTVISMFIPCVSYITADEGAHAALSEAELVSNSWTTVRYYLFSGAADIREVSRSFGMTTLILMLSFIVLFILGAIFVAYFTAAVFRYIRYPERNDRERAVFLTLVPNRTVSFLYMALCLPLTAFPRILPILYDNILYYHVEVEYTFADPFAVAAVLYVIGIVLSALTRDLEVGLEMNPFKKNFHHSTVGVREEEENHSPDTETDGSDSRYGELASRAREEQMEAIRKLLKGNDDNNKG